MNPSDTPPEAPRTDALHDRASAWTKEAIQRAKVVPFPGTDKFTATLPLIRSAAVMGDTEGQALAALETLLYCYALRRLVEGEALPQFAKAPVPVSPEVVRLVRLSNLRHELRVRSAQWNAQRRNLPAHVVNACLADIDAVVTRHAAAIESAA